MLGNSEPRESNGSLGSFHSWRIRSRLQARWRLVVLAEVGSTNDVVWRLGREGVAVFANAQRIGRGRRGRAWVAPPGSSILLSLMVAHDGPLIGLALVPALAICDAIWGVTGLAAALKWPNDVLLGGRKVSGVLVENRQTDARSARAIVGIGINVQQEDRDLPARVAYPATSLRLASGLPVDRAHLAARLLDSLASRIEEWRAAPERTRQHWRDRLTMLGQRVTIEVPGAPPLRGVAEDVDRTGALVLRLSDGTARAVSEGTVLATDDGR